MPLPGPDNPITDAPDRATAEKRAELWLRENLDALQSSNDYVEQNGLPLAKYRQF